MCVCVRERVCVCEYRLLALLVPHTSALAHESINANGIAVSHVALEFTSHSHALPCILVPCRLGFLA